MVVGSFLTLKPSLLFKVITCILCLYYVLSFTYTCTYQYDVNKATTFITKNANARSKSLCARYVRLALEAGGCKTWGYPLTAKGYSDFLLDLDFSVVEKKGYQKRKGDIVVFNAVKGHPFGHIAMWNGKQWVSDFRQRSFYVAKGYIDSKDFQYYRMNKKHPQRSFRLSHLAKWMLESVVNGLKLLLN